ncbi:MAG TPA: pitrilysin family protein [Gemmataceae bacterium]|nr:pitrilysin family protein [Gemmataceae bacterium]
MPQQINTHTLPNGLTLLAERMPHVRSASFHLLVPAGAAYDPPGKFGLAGLVCDLMTRGAGDRDSRELSDALDNLGVDRGESAGTLNVQLSGATLSRNLLPALEIYADILRRPHLPEDELDAAKMLSLQDIQSIEDEPQRKVMVELRKRYYPDPLGRDNRGTEAGVEAVTIDDVRRQHSLLFQPRDGILAVAGDIDWPALKAKVEDLFGDWKAGDRPTITTKPIDPQSGHMQKDLDQTQISLAFPSVPIGHPDFYAARGMVGVLSQDMSSRLFTNVREKHGLCYSVYASYETFKDRATIVGYAGARPELAQETLDRTLDEFRNLANGIDGEEIDRVKIGLKSALIMRQESTGARSGAMASDWYFLNRVRPLEEVQAAVDGITVPAVLDYVRRYPAKDVTIVTLGPAALKS